MASSTTRPTGSNVEEYRIFISKSSRKSFQMMKFNRSTNVDFGKWRKAELQRENNSKIYEAETEELPEFGKGSQFGEKKREAAKRRRFQKIDESYNPNEQPWILKTYEEKSREYQSQIEGGFSDNAAYYVLTQAEGGLEAHSIKEWYSFQRRKQLQTFTAEEVEEQFQKRNNYTNYFSLVKRMRLNRIAEEEEEGKKKSKPSVEADNSDLDESSDEECERIVNKKGKKGRKTKKQDSDDEAVEESDDGDGEGKEFDYISSGESDNEVKERGIIGVAEEKAIRQALDSDEDDSEEENFQNISRVQDGTQEHLYTGSKSLDTNHSNKTKFGNKSLVKEDKKNKSNKSNSNLQKFKTPVFVVKQRQSDDGTKKKNKRN